MYTKFLKIFLGLLLCLPLSSGAFSILAHEAIIDAEWGRTLVPILKQKYPAATDQELITAHAYAYGGSLVADIGYMPGGNAHFTDLLHYVRSGDFITCLIKEAGDINEYAFALGALSHYIADKYGHSQATNVTVPLLYPELRQKFGNEVTYEDDHVSHSRMEFAYDVVQIGRSNYASVAYHDFIGFNIATAPLERAFLKTYGQHLHDYFSNFSSSISILRWGVKNLFPALTKQAWKSKKDEITKGNPAATSHTFRYKMRKYMYKQEFGGKSSKPDFKARALAFLVHILPKVGPLKSLKFKYPTAEGERRFVATFDTIVVRYAGVLNQVKDGNLQFEDINFDTGKPAVYGAYHLADKAYCKLVNMLQKQGMQCMTPELQQHIVQYYENVDLRLLFKDSPEKIQAFSLALEKVKAYPAATNVLTRNANSRIKR
ncbi:zinc dependent phospholipase C family protein [Mucilaginibacter sp. Bleaf8]|uniref:zinc dependent phospholipase C family protein n=1 Tax=Mucilaginibacter sp. Bleaf8 TaxID=2834430 RepID=UPI001BCBAA7E|nr:zinc dependent phospholipase C family protein [Mucilaginibacter sp. Bleaf8]MBS7564148.1 zinc dependent phospholipase C family protein [Mucilaginibacter sp. Bleaf8]